MKHYRYMFMAGNTLIQDSANSNHGFYDLMLASSSNHITGVRFREVSD